MRVPGFASKCNSFFTSDSIVAIASTEGAVLYLYILFTFTVPLSETLTFTEQSPFPSVVLTGFISPPSNCAISLPSIISKTTSLSFAGTGIGDGSSAVASDII